MINQAILSEMVLIRDAMQKIAVGENIVGKSLLTFKQMKDFISSESNGYRKYIVVKTGEEFQIVRIPDNSDPVVFEKHVRKAPGDYQVRTMAESLLVVLANYLAKDWESVAKSNKIVTEIMKEKNQIPYSYIQSYCSNMAAFKREGVRAKELLLSHVMHCPRLTLMDRGASFNLYGTRVPIYLIK